MPDEQEYYVHRIGRTGRAKKHGVAYTFVASVTDQIKMDEIAQASDKLSTVANELQASTKKFKI